MYGSFRGNFFTNIDSLSTNGFNRQYLFFITSNGGFIGLTDNDLESIDNFEPFVFILGTLFGWVRAVFWGTNMDWFSVNIDDSENLIAGTYDFGLLGNTVNDL